MAFDPAAFEHLFFQETDASREFLTLDELRALCGVAHERIVAFAHEFDLRAPAQVKAYVLDSPARECHVVRGKGGEPVVLIHSGLLFGVAAAIRRSCSSLEACLPVVTPRCDVQAPALASHDEAESWVEQALAFNSGPQSGVWQLALSDALLFILIHELIHSAYGDVDVRESSSVGPRLVHGQEFRSDREALRHAVAVAVPSMARHIFFEAPARVGLPQLKRPGPMFWPIIEACDMPAKERLRLIGVGAGLWCLFSLMQGESQGEHPSSASRWVSVYKADMPMPWARFLKAGAQKARSEMGCADVPLQEEVGFADDLMAELEAEIERSKSERRKGREK